MRDFHGDRTAIADVVHGYAQAIRQRRYPQAAELFAPDGWFEIREGAPGAAGTRLVRRLEGQAAVLDYLLSTAGHPVQPIPMIHNLIVTLHADDDGPPRASAASLMEAQLFPSERRMLGEYADSFVTVDGAWRIAERNYTIFRAPPAQDGD